MPVKPTSLAFVWVCLGASLLAACPDTRTITAAELCGNGVIDQGEACDGTNLKGRSCLSTPVPNVPGQTFQGGKLGCAADCKSFDTSQCKGYCGDGVLNQSAGEQCDGTVFEPALQSCQEGSPSCTADCKGTCAVCGDGVCQSNVGENCKSCPEDCSCSLYGTCNAQGTCDCFVAPFVFVNCNEGVTTPTTVDVGCSQCGDPSCSPLIAPPGKETWAQFAQAPSEYMVCSPGPQYCTGISGALYDWGGCEPFFQINDFNTNFNNCVQDFIDDLENAGLWPAGHPRFSSGDVHTLSTEIQLTCQ